MFHIKIKQCASALASGKVIAYPTEAVWGLGCDPFNQHAVSEVLTLKKRSWKKGLILVAADVTQIEFLLSDLSEDKKQCLAESWPGHVTFLIPHCNRIPALVTGVHDTIAIRVSAHPIVKALCEEFGGPIVSTSANPQGLNPATTKFKAQDYFGTNSPHDVMFAPGNVGAQAKPSKIIDLMSGQQLR